MNSLFLWSSARGCRDMQMLVKARTAAMKRATDRKLLCLLAVLFYKDLHLAEHPEGRQLMVAMVNKKGSTHCIEPF